MESAFEESKFVREFADFVHSRPRSWIDIAHQLTMMNIVEPDDMTPTEWALYQEGTLAALRPVARQNVVKVLMRDLGVNRIVATDESIRKMVQLLGGHPDLEQRTDEHNHPDRLGARESGK